MLGISLLVIEAGQPKGLEKVVFALDLERCPKRQMSFDSFEGMLRDLKKGYRFLMG